MFILTYVRSLLRSPPQPTTDLIIRTTGSFGKYQLYLCFLVFLSKFAIAAHQMAIIFLAPKTVHSCGDVENLCPCENPVYDKSVFKKSMVTEFKLICERKWLVSFSQTIFQLGTLVGSILFGMASDRFGRKPSFCFACCIQILFGIVAAFIPSYEWFTFVRFLVGVSVGGTMVIGFVILMEFIGPEYREVVAALYQLPFNMGHMLLPLASYLARDYDHFQLVISTPEVIYLIYICLLSEPPRWLIAKKRTDKAIKILEKVAKMNKRQTDDIKQNVLTYQALAEKNKLKPGNVLDLFRTPNLRKNNIAMALNWFTCSYCFYGVSQYVGQLSGDIFINVACSASVTALGTLSSIPLMKLFGRKTILIICHFVCATCLFILAFIPEGVGSVICASVGVVSSFIVFVVVYLYSGELFPTVVRSAAIGFSSMTARIGSMIAPFVVDLRDVKMWLAPFVFALAPFFAMFITLLLPETKGCQLTTTIEEGEAFGKKVKKPRTTQ